MERKTGWGGECDEEFARLRHAGVVGDTAELAGRAGSLSLQAVAQRIAYVVDGEHVVLLPVVVGTIRFHQHDEDGFTIGGEPEAYKRGDGRVERMPGLNCDERRTGPATDILRTGSYRQDMENQIRAGNTTPPRLEA